jgi:glutamine amidotransferase
MQLLMTESEEEGKYFGLDLVRGKVLRFSQGKIPQIGWNSVHGMRSPLFEGIPEDTQFYFVHSYYCAPKQENVIGMTDYYGDYASAISCGNAYGVQFHPEKSGEAGLALLRNFMRI